MSEEEELEKIGVQKCEKCGMERPLLNPITPCPCELSPEKYVLSGELRPALLWKDALLKINELQKEIDRLKELIRRKDEGLRGILYLFYSGQFIEKESSHVGAIKMREAKEALELGGGE